MACGIVAADTVNNFYLKAVETMKKNVIAPVVLAIVMIALICYVQNLIWINTGP